MKPFTLDENLTFGYGTNLFNFNKDGPFWCAYARAERIPESFRAECVRTAQLVSAQAAELGRKPVILLSGGLDSEVTVKAFQEAEVSYDTITFRFPDKLNDFELVYVEKFCAKHGLTPNYYDIDIKTWARSDEARELFVKSNCQFFEMIPHMKVLNHVWETGGLPVMGNGDVFLKKIDGAWHYVEFEYILAWFRHCIRNHILGGIGFFQHTPEITLAALRDPQMESVGLGRGNSKLLKDGRMAKYVMYRKHWPDLEHRPKFNGGEKLHTFYHGLAEPLRKQFTDEWTMPYTQFRELHEPLDQH